MESSNIDQIEDEVHLLQERDEIDNRFSPMVVEEDGEEEEEEEESDEMKWTRKIALICGCTFGVGSHFAVHIVGPLKDTLRENLGISNAQFSLLQSSLSLFPTILPLLGGMIIERFGIKTSSILFTSIILLGQTLVLMSVYGGNVEGMVIGFCVFGVGAGPIVTVMETIFVRFARNKNVSLVMGLGLSAGKIAGFIASITAIPLSKTLLLGWQGPFVVSTLFCALSWLANLFYLRLVNKMERMGKISNKGQGHTTRLRWQDIYGFSNLFWCYLLICVGFGSVWTPFAHLSQSVIKHRYYISDFTAALNASIIFALPIVLFPFLGLVLDKVGKRCYILTGCALCLVLCYAFILLPPDSIFTPHPLIPLLLFGLSISCGPITLVTAVPYLTRHIPTGLGLHTCVESIGATFFGTLAGVLLDLHMGKGNTTVPIGPNDDLPAVRLFFGISLVTFVGCVVFWYGDRYWERDGDESDGPLARKGILNAGERLSSLAAAVDPSQTISREEEFELKGTSYPAKESNLTPIRRLKVNIFVGASVISLVTSWVYFAVVVSSHQYLEHIPLKNSTIAG
ncbi:uncharacterized protein VTP21DRAFT_6742 [Calcarisporiella thermophila]|uniref:uncharacterized protein n=1 Tax=Calcarisporiella thermophila TaxID=911321 RepID=UPI003743CEA0